MQRKKAKFRSIIIFIIFLIAIILFFSISMHFVQRVHTSEEMNLNDRLQTFELPNSEPERVTSTDDSTSIRLPILMYHHIDDDPERFQSGTITPERFADDMRQLVAYGFETIDTSSIRMHIEGTQRLPERPILVTIDDGYRSMYEHIFPVLQQLNLKAISTVIGSSIGRDTHLFHGTPIIPHYSWDEAIKMVESGLVDIQSHSFDLHLPGQHKNEARGAAPLHGELLEQYRERFKKDTLNNERFIEKHVHNEVVLYAYPYGIYNEITEQSLKELGYLITLTTEPGIATVTDDFFQLPRINMAAFSTSEEAFQSIKNELENDEHYANDVNDEIDENNDEYHEAMP